MKRVYYIRARVSVEAIVSVVAETEEQAMERLNKGAWHGVKHDQNWDSGKVDIFRSIQEGPRVSPR